MLTLDTFLHQIVTDPEDAADTWLVLADWLEEQNDPRFELVRLLHQPGYVRSIEERNARLRPLLDSVPPLFENSLNAHFAWVLPGTFWMGGGGGVCGTTQMTIEQGFALGVFPVTQAQWQAVMGFNPCDFSRTGDGKDRIEDISDEELEQFPVEWVSQDEVRQFLQKLNEKERNSGWSYRLPTEEEWEYACRGAAASREECSYHFYFEKPTNDLSSAQANCDGRDPFGHAATGPYLKRPTRVGSYAPNRLGLYDMHGNVWEDCTTAQDSTRVVRGGSWRDDASYARAAQRHDAGGTSRYYDIGFRLARSLVPQRDG